MIKTLRHVRFANLWVDLWFEGTETPTQGAYPGGHCPFDRSTKSHALTEAIEEASLDNVVLNHGYRGLVLEFGKRGEILRCVAHTGFEWPRMSQEDLVERLAELGHTQWVFRMDRSVLPELADVLIVPVPGGLPLCAICRRPLDTGGPEDHTPSCCVGSWMRQMDTPYELKDEATKAVDRHWARKVFDVLRGAGS